MLVSEDKRNEVALTEMTREFLGWAQKTLKAKGFVRTDARNLSAMFEWTFTRGTRRIVLCGWHGTGKRGTCRHFGDLKLCFTIYDSPDIKFTRAVLDLDLSKATAEDARQFEREARNYLYKVQ